MVAGLIVVSSAITVHTPCAGAQGLCGIVGLNGCVVLGVGALGGCAWLVRVHDGLLLHRHGKVLVK